MSEKNPKQIRRRRFSSSRTLSLGEPPINHNCLRDHPFFKERDPRLFKLMLENMSLKVFHPGVTMVKEGDEPDRAYLLHRGEVEVLIGPEEQLVAKLGDCDLFGDMALLGMGKRAATVRALAFCVCLSIDAVVFEACLQRFPAEKIYFDKLVTERLAARKVFEVDLRAKPIKKLKKSVQAVSFLLRVKAKFTSSPPLSAADSPGQEEKLPHPCSPSAATSTGCTEDVSEASGPNVSQNPIVVGLPPQAKKQSSGTLHKRKFLSNQESSCHDSERSSGDVDRFSYDKYKCTSTTQSTDWPHDLWMIACATTSRSTDCLDDKWMIEPSERLPSTAPSRIQTTTSRSMDPMCQEAQDSTPAADSNIVSFPQTVPPQVKLNSTSCQEASDQDSVGKPGNYDATGHEVSPGQDDSLSNRFDVAESPFQLIPKPKLESASCQDALDPVCFAKPILVDAAHREKAPGNSGSRRKRRSLSCTAATLGPPRYLPPLKTTQRAVATWWRTQSMHCHQ